MEQRESTLNEEYSMKVNVLVYCALVISLLSCDAFASPKKETQGQVADGGGLLKVHTVCLDASSSRSIAVAFNVRALPASSNWFPAKANPTNRNMSRTMAARAASSCTPQPCASICNLL